jgi:fluoroquinolone resistance protein
MSIYESRIFKQSNFDDLDKGEYYDCSFHQIDLSSFNFSGFKFIECEFTNCNLNLCNPNNAFFQQVHFLNCKMLGIHFDYLNPFGLEMTFEKCQLNHAIFYQLKLKGINFISCKLIETDFTECDLSGANFQDCDLLGAVFDQTNLENVDFCSPNNFIIEPDKNKLKNAKFSVEGLPGLLTKFGIQVS